MSKKKKEWRAEKEHLLSLGLEDRRKDYRGNYVPLDKIPTWANHDNNTATEEEERKSFSLADKVSLYKGDITILEVDAIVNAANSSLLGGGGVDGCIHRAAGHLLYEECHSLNGCETGKAKITCGYDLPAKYVIHTVGPIARGNVGQFQRDDLESCYKCSLKLMKDNNLRSVAFPCISTGIYGFPNEPAAEIALKTVRDWILSNQDEVGATGGGKPFLVHRSSRFKLEENIWFEGFFIIGNPCEEKAVLEPESTVHFPDGKSIEAYSSSKRKI